MNKRQLTSKHRVNSFYGELGTYTRKLNSEIICVGDMVLYVNRGRLYTGIVCHDMMRDRFSIMGYMSEDILNINIQAKILSHELLTNEIAKLHDFDIEENKVKMTLSEIEKVLGYSIELVNK